MHVISNAHSNAIITLRTMSFNGSETLLCSGSKDKQMKIWGNIRMTQDNRNIEKSNEISEMTLSHYS